ncbi:hypothetical protein EMIHUDRAFT_452396, partial [Emiliania huxleyi CCMP1516]|uniref:TOG domain-containing protein n=2 Tax=Emiliania huxleyi TaxID=2903 RepID=A0A0D3IK22_EMIH1
MDAAAPPATAADAPMHDRPPSDGSPASPAADAAAHAAADPVPLTLSDIRTSYDNFEVAGFGQDEVRAMMLDPACTKPLTFREFVNGLSKSTAISNSDNRTDAPAAEDDSSLDDIPSSTDAFTAAGPGPSIAASDWLPQAVSAADSHSDKRTHRSLLERLRQHSRGESGSAFVEALLEAAAVAAASPRRRTPLGHAQLLSMVSATVEERCALGTAECEAAVAAVGPRLPALAALLHGAHSSGEGSAAWRVGVSSVRRLLRAHGSLLASAQAWLLAEKGSATPPASEAADAACALAGAVLPLLLARGRASAEQQLDWAAWSKLLGGLLATASPAVAIDGFAPLLGALPAEELLKRVLPAVTKALKRAAEGALASLAFPPCGAAAAAGAAEAQGAAEAVASYLLPLAAREASEPARTAMMAAVGSWVGVAGVGSADAAVKAVGAGLVDKSAEVRRAHLAAVLGGLQSAVEGGGAEGGGASGALLSLLKPSAAGEPLLAMGCALSEPLAAACTADKLWQAALKAKEAFAWASASSAGEKGTAEGGALDALAAEGLLRGAADAVAELVASDKGAASASRDTRLAALASLGALAASPAEVRAAVTAALLPRLEAPMREAADELAAATPSEDVEAAIRATFARRAAEAGKPAAAEKKPKLLPLLVRLPALPALRAADGGGWLEALFESLLACAAAPLHAVRAPVARALLRVLAPGDAAGESGAGGSEPLALAPLLEALLGACDGMPLPPAGYSLLLPLLECALADRAAAAASLSLLTLHAAPSLPLDQPARRTSVRLLLSLLSSDRWRADAAVALEAELLPELAALSGRERAQAARALAAAAADEPPRLHTLLQRLFEMHKEASPPPKAAAGSEEEDDGWRARHGVALCLAAVAPAASVMQLPVAFAFLKRALADEVEEVAAAMTAAGCALINEQGAPDRMVPLLAPMFETMLSEAATTEADDRVRTGVVVCFGALARHIPPDDPKVGLVLSRLVDSLATPSEVVQRTAAKSLSALLSRAEVKPRGAEVLQELLATLLATPSYAMRRGAAFGLAGVVKGLGIASLKKEGVMAALQAAIE